MTWHNIIVIVTKMNTNELISIHVYKIITWSSIIITRNNNNNENRKQCEEWIAFTLVLVLRKLDTIHSVRLLPLTDEFPEWVESREVVYYTFIILLLYFYYTFIILWGRRGQLAFLSCRCLCRILHWFYKMLREL